MSTILIFILFIEASAQFNSNPAVSELNGAATLSWQIPAGGVPTGFNFYAISPAGTAAFAIINKSSFILSEDFKGRAEFIYPSKNITFTLRNISSTDAGTFSCGIGRFEGITVVIPDCGQMLVVLGKPTKSSLPSPNTIPVFNEQVTLTCTSTSTSIPRGHGLTLNFTWERDGTIAASDTGRTFTFTVTSRDLQSYRCKADESRGLESEWSDVYTMEPVYGPYQVSLTPPGLSYILRENQTTVPPISCSANCKPDCAFHWEKNGTIFSNSAVLNLGQASRSKTGFYRCRVVNNHGIVHTAAVSVEVQYLDRPIFTMDQSEVRENESVILKCSAVSHPTAMLTVRNVDNDTVVVQQETDELTYTIPRAQCLHNGSFVCSAEHKAGAVLFSHMVSLNVLCSPRLDTRKPLQRNVSSGLDEVASLLLNVKANPAPTFRWYLRVNQQSVPIPNITQHEIISTAKFSVLQIHVTHSRDYASYVVEATSNHVTFTTIFNLLPTGSSSQEVLFDRLGIGIVIGFAVCLPAFAIGIVVYVCYKKRGSSTKKGTQANQEIQIDRRTTHDNDNRATYSDLTPTPGNEYEELKVQRSEDSPSVYQNASFEEITHSDL